MFTRLLIIGRSLQSPCFETGHSAGAIFYLIFSTRFIWTSRNLIRELSTEGDWYFIKIRDIFLPLSIKHHISIACLICNLWLFTEICFKMVQCSMGNLWFHFRYNYMNILLYFFFFTIFIALKKKHHNCLSKEVVQPSWLKRCNLKFANIVK